MLLLMKRKSDVASTAELRFYGLSRDPIYPDNKKFGHLCFKNTRSKIKIKY